VVNSKRVCTLQLPAVTDRRCPDWREGNAHKELRGAALIFRMNSTRIRRINEIIRYLITLGTGFFNPVQVHGTLIRDMRVQR
jgi:hypothetical protein